MVAAFVLMSVLHIIAAFMVSEAVTTGQRLEVEREGKMIVSRSFLGAVELFENKGKVREHEPSFSNEAVMIQLERGGSKKEIEKRLRDTVAVYGRKNLVPESDIKTGFYHSIPAGELSALLGSMVLLLWFVMLVCQGEGLELDLQRRRHPMWEWLLSHPVRPGAVFLAEMLSPVAANPVYLTAPVFVGVLYGFIHGPMTGAFLAVLVGIPVAISAACLGKALETMVILRLSQRTKGAVIGIISWLGYALMMLFLLSASGMSQVMEALGRVLAPLAGLPWPWLGWFLGQIGGTFSLPLGMFDGLFFSVVVTCSAVGITLWGLRQGLGGKTDSLPAKVKDTRIRFGREPLYRKEFLWFIRDRSAIVQTILIPLTIAGFQIFNLRGVLQASAGAWNYLCGVAILVGTYFLWILGPKSLASEGAALWIPLTWPRGLESLLKAKAWLWSMISTGIVGLVLAFAAFRFPADAWKIALVGVGWFFFSRSMAEKSVTLVSVTSSSGEPEKVPAARRWAASLGMLTFAIGIFSQQWNLAVVGIVYSTITAAAMWENFRARLPYLYDPWSEKVPPPPTLMNAMIAISLLVEVGAVLVGVAVLFLGKENFAVAQTFGYGLCAIGVSVGTAIFLRNRGVKMEAVWCWKIPSHLHDQKKLYWCGDGKRDVHFALALCLGLGSGLLLGLGAFGYLEAMSRLPMAEEIIQQSKGIAAKIPNYKLFYGIMAVAFAPLAEEYLFRGLLFRALDREWGGWKAILGSAAFFAIYHPVLSWLPVGLLGVLCALLFKKTGRLAPCVLLHMTYNFAVVWWS
ncbi:MAG TPA: CPBP family intramembrane glutamic endopeptidase [Chthoniobacterales bacterium]